MNNGKAYSSFNTNSKPLIRDYRVSLSVTFYKDNFILGTYKPLSCVTISGIASGLEAAGIGSVLYKISDDNGTLLDLQIDRVLHLKQLPQRLISPQQVLKQHYSPGDGFFMYNTHSILKIGGHTKTISYDPLTNLPIFYTKSGVDKLYNLTHDSDTTDNLSKTQKELLHWHRRLGHMDFEKIKDLSRQGLLPKELSTFKSPLCSFCIQAKQQRNSITSMATGGAIKSGNLKPGSKISCDQYYSREPGFIANNNGLVLSKESAKYGTLFVDHASDFIFHFLQTSPDGSQTVDAKHKFETFAKNCGVDIRHYHADNKIFNNQLFKESCITPSALIINSNDDLEDAGSIAQGNTNDTVTTRSGRNILRLKRYLQTAVLGLLSSKIGSPISSNSDSLHSISILKAQTDYENILNILPDGTNNKFHPLMFIASQANTDVLYYHQAMKADDAKFFKNAMEVEIKSFKEEKIFKLILKTDKPDDKSLIPFV